MTRRLSAGLEPNSLDAVLFIMSYHDLYWRPNDGSWTATDPAMLLEKVHAAVKPGGIVIVEDHVAPAGADPVVGVDKLHRIDPVGVRKRDFERAGFKFDGESKVLAHPDDDHTKIVFDDSVQLQDRPGHLSIPQIVCPDRLPGRAFALMLRMRRWTDSTSWPPATAQTRSGEFCGSRCGRARGTSRPR